MAMIDDIDYPTTPTGSLTRGWRPSLAWLFQHIRGSTDRDYITKEDLSAMFGGQIEAGLLDEAFDKLDSDSNGCITLDEFMGGFSTFLREAQSHNNSNELVPPDEAAGFYRSRSGSMRKRSATFEETFENDTNSRVIRPSDSFKRSLKPLSTRNRHSIEQLWTSLNDSDPDLISDFEDFIGEMAQEVDLAQIALKKQREVTKQEALELDEEMERLHNDSQAKLQLETAIVREKAQNQLQEQLKEKETELLSVKAKLEQLEGDMAHYRHAHLQLEQSYHETIQDKEDLQKQLEASEHLLQESQHIVQQLRQATEQQERADDHEAQLYQLRLQYQEELNMLKDHLQTLQRSQPSDGAIRQDSINIDDDSNAPPSHLLTTHNNCIYHTHNNCHTPGSLLNEIVETEGKKSPAFKSTMIHATPTDDLQYGSPIDGITFDNLDHLDHLDLAVTPPSPTRSSNTLSLATTTNNKKLYGSDINLDLRWPPGNWAVPPHGQELIASVAATSTTPQTTPTHKVKHTDFESNTRGESEERHIDTTDDHEIHNNDSHYQPLEFVESLVVQPHVTFKILIVGNPHVGKSCFLMRLCTNTFTTRYASTIGVDFYSRSIKFGDKIISLQLWDTAGQERFQSVTRSYYRGAHGIILMYDVMREESFIAVKTWINSIQDNMDQLPTAILLVGNKVDLEEHSKKEVLTETGETFAKIYNADFMETSAKTGYNVGEACLKLVKKLVSDETLIQSINGDHRTLTPHKENTKWCSC